MLHIILSLVLSQAIFAQDITESDKQLVNTILEQECRKEKPCTEAAYNTFCNNYQIKIAAIAQSVPFLSENTNCKTSDIIKKYALSACQKQCDDRKAEAANKGSVKADEQATASTTPPTTSPVATTGTTEQAANTAPATGASATSAQTTPAAAPASVIEPPVPAEAGATASAGGSVSLSTSSAIKSEAYMDLENDREFKQLVKDECDKDDSCTVESYNDDFCSFMYSKYSVDASSCKKDVTLRKTILKECKKICFVQNYLAPFPEYTAASLAYTNIPSQFKGTFHNNATNPDTSLQLDFKLSPLLFSGDNYRNNATIEASLAIGEENSDVLIKKLKAEMINCTIDPKGDGINFTAEAFSLLYQYVSYQHGVQVGSDIAVGIAPNISLGVIDVDILPSIKGSIGYASMSQGGPKFEGAKDIVRTTRLEVTIGGAYGKRYIIRTGLAFDSAVKVSSNKSNFDSYKGSQFFGEAGYYLKNKLCPKGRPLNCDYPEEFGKQIAFFLKLSNEKHESKFLNGRDPNKQDNVMFDVYALAHF